MLKFLKSKTSADKTAKAVTTATVEDSDRSWLKRLTGGLQRTRQKFTAGLANAVLGKKQIDASCYELIETQLLTADVGVATTQTIIAELTARVSRKQLTDPQTLLQQLKQILIETLQPCSQPLVINPENRPYVILMIGVNGAGKTTTIGKLAKQFQQQGLSVCLAAGDTFRAAAVEQLQVWGERNAIPVIAQQTGADSASVVYDALQAAKARGFDVLIADTAGRLHTQGNLMNELEKVKRVLTKLDPTAPHEVMLILDAGIGQNAISQLREFNAAVKVTGITLTKLDGTAKGGIIFALAKQFAIPIRYVGVGEGIDDLHPFVAEEFIEALFKIDDHL